MPINGTIRDCASQRYDYQDYKDGKWSMQVSVEEPYQEGCSTIDDKGWRSSKTQYCYCRGNLCNGTSSNYQINFILMLTVIFLLHICSNAIVNR